MGTTLYISFDREISGLNPNAADRVFLADVVAKFKVLKPLARKLKVRSLSEFQSYDSKDAAEFIDDPEELKKVIAASPPIEWFDPAEGLKSVRAFREHFETSPSDIPGRGKKRASDLLRELLEVESLLARAVEEKVRFRFHIGF